MTDVRITGVGLHPFGRFPDRTVTDLGVTAVRAALAEAGEPSFDAAFCGTAYAGVAAGHKVLSAIGRTGGPILDVEAGCASGAAALMLAAGAIDAGQYDTVLVFGIEKMPKRASSAPPSSSRGARRRGSPRHRRTSRSGPSGSNARRASPRSSSPASS